MASSGVLVIGIIVILAIVVVAVPLVDIEVQEAYTTSEPYTENVPYSTVENKEQSLGSTNDKTLEGGYYTYWSPTISLGRDIEFSFSASDTLHMFIFTKNQYDTYEDGGGGITNADKEKELLEAERGTLGYHVSASGSYYFVIYNPHDGFLGFGDKNVGIYAASITSYWQEEVTRYRTETKYRTVTKYRTATKKVPIINLLTDTN